MEMLNEGFKAAAEWKNEMFMKLEWMRHREMLEHEIQLKEVDNERRRLFFLMSQQSYPIET